MPEVIYMPQKRQRRDPTAEMRGVLTRLAMMKMQHDYNMDITDRRLEAEKIRVAEEREYQTGRADKKLKQELELEGFQELEAQEPTRQTVQAGKTVMQAPESWAKPQITPVISNGKHFGYSITHRGKSDFIQTKGAYKEGQIVPVKEGNEIVNYEYTGGELVEKSRGERYKPASTTVNIGKSSASERENLARGEASIAELDNLKGLFDESFVGPIAGRVGSVKDIFGGNKEKQSEFNAATFAFKNFIIKEITGAQMSEVEAARIMKQIPDVNNPPSVWKAKWKQSKRNVATLRKKRLEIMKKSGVITPDISVSVDTNDDPFNLFPKQ